ncbi:MAG: dephospho-CoA kinase [Desulfurivibrionaceae bacterium]|nr:dephospho-CoA kinase [Desulfurivibrionaceae bacterium]
MARLMAGQGGNKEGVVGITGFIGSGKSRVSRFLASRLAWPCLEADRIARDLMQPGEPGWLAVREYDHKYIRPDGRLDRPLLRQDIFSDPQVKRAVDGRIHPLVRAKLQELLGPGGRALVEVPLLFEAGWDAFFGRIILVYADYDTCLQRVMARDRVTAQQARQAYQCQMPAMEKIKRAHHVIDNSGAWWNTQLQLLHLLDILSGRRV